MKTANALPRFAGNTITPLPAPARGCELWLCRLDRDERSVAAMATSLSPNEHTRAARFGTDLLRRRWIVGRAMLRALLGAKLGVEPHAVELKSGRRGRPQLAGQRSLEFNVSHTQQIALIAIADDLLPGARIGVDIERADRGVNAEALARKFLTERERVDLMLLDPAARRQRFLRLWTCKEAMSKATGDALSAPFRAIEIALRDQPQLVAGPPPYTPHRWRLVRAAAPADLIATLAIWQPA